MLQRLISYWVYGGVLAGILLLALPAYMIHQYEEHDRDRFRLFFNETIGEGLDVLSPLAVFLTNVIGVWGVLALSLYGAVMFSLGWALVAVYLRRYNPGLLTAVAVFLPLGVITLVLIQRAGGGSVGSHAMGLLIAVAFHAGILLWVRHKILVFQAPPN